MLDKVVGVYQESDQRVIIELTEGEVELDFFNALELLDMLSDLLEDDFCRECEHSCSGEDPCYPNTN